MPVPDSWEEFKKQRDWLRDNWQQDSPVTQVRYPIQDALLGAPTRDAQTLESMYNETNQYLPKDQRFNPPESVQQLRYLSKLHDFTGYNAQETRKYFDPRTQTKWDTRNTGGINGSVWSNDPGTITLGPKASQKTVLHEANHADQNLSGTNAKFLNWDTSPMSDFYNNIRPETLPSFDKYVKSGNYTDGIDEIRSELRAGLGMQRYGTKSQDYFKDLIDQVLTRNPNLQHDGSRIPDSRKKWTVSPDITRDNALKFLEQDLFPRERWIEPREPTFSERMSDRLKSLKDIFKR